MLYISNYSTGGGSGTVTSIATGTGLTGGTITGSGTISLSTALAPIATLTGNSLKYLRVNAGESAVEWATVSGSGTPGGSDTQVQFNDAGAFGGDSGFVYDKTTGNLILNKVLAAISLGQDNGETGITTPDVTTGQISAGLGILTGRGGIFGSGGLFFRTGDGLDNTTGIISDLFTNNVGTGYTVNDILTISGGGTNAQIQVTSIGGTGDIVDYIFLNYGTGYSTATGVALTGGTGTSATVDILVDGSRAGGIYLQAGNSYSSTLDSRDVVIQASFVDTGVVGTAKGGDVTITGGDGAQSGNGGGILLQSGSGGSTAGTGGDILLQPLGGATGEGVVMIMNNATAKSVRFDTSLLATTDKTFTFPNASGTFALTSDLSAYALLAGSTAQAFSVSQLEVGNTDTTITRTGAGAIAVEGVTVPTISSTNTLTNKRITPRVLSAASYTTDTGTSLDVSTCDVFIVTAQAGALKLNNPSGTPVQGEKLIVRIKDNGTARALTYDTQFRAMGNALPSTTVLSKTIYMGFMYNSTDTKWDLIALAQEA